MTSVLYREGDCFEVILLDEFSRNGVLEFLEMTEEDLIPQDRLDATEMTIEMFDNGMTVIAVFNSDGESKNFIGRNDEFVGFFDEDTQTYR